MEKNIDANEIRLGRYFDELEADFYSTGEHVKYTFPSDGKIEHLNKLYAEQAELASLKDSGEAHQAEANSQSICCSGGLDRLVVDEQNPFIVREEIIMKALKDKSKGNPKWFENYLGQVCGSSASFKGKVYLLGDENVTEHLVNTASYLERCISLISEPGFKKRGEALVKNSVNIKNLDLKVYIRKLESFCKTYSRTLSCILQESVNFDEVDIKKV